MTLTQKVSIKTAFLVAAVLFGVLFVTILALAIYIGILLNPVAQDIVALFCAVTDSEYNRPTWVKGLSFAFKFSITSLVLLQTLTILSIIASVVLIKRFFDNRGQEVDYP